MFLGHFNPFTVYRGLPRSIYILFLAAVINGMGNFVYPFLALFLTVKLDFTPAAAGAFISFSALIYVPGALLGGKLCDMAGRRVVAFGAQALASVMFFICGFHTGSRIILPLIVLNLLFDGFADPARQAMQTDLTNPENRQKSFALNYLGHNLGFALGPIIAGFLFDRASPWLFFGNAILGLAAVSLKIIFLPETKPTERQIAESFLQETGEKGVKGSLFAAIAQRPGLVIFALFVTLYGLCYGQVNFSLPITLTAESAFGASGSRIFGLLMSSNALLVVLLNAPAVSFSRKFKTLNMVAFAGVLYAIGFAACIIAGKSLLIFFIGTLIWTLGEIIDAVNTWYYIANQTPITHRGRFSGVFPLLTHSGRAAAPWVGGSLISRWGLRTLWALTALAVLAAAGGLKIFQTIKDRKAKNPDKP
ncbi:MAG: MFS transporter [Spirochaetales bacterium]|jgi:MFS family permease|nr:MFS transporter [Spirochaetales bacterium]